MLLRLPAPSASVSMFSLPSVEQIAELNKCDFVLLPGSTILAKGVGQGEATACLSRIKVPKFCVAASCWSPNFPLNEDILKHITPPIGVRDPDTLIACKKLGVEAVLVGCPTAYVSKITVLSSSPYSIVGFSRTDIDWQVSLFSKVAGVRVAAIQEPLFSDPIAQKFTKRTIHYSNPNDVYTCYAGASAVYTGRLHGVLPAMSQEKPVFFFGNPNDSRFSLLKFYGIEIHPLGYMGKLTLDNKDQYKDAIVSTKNMFYQWAKQTLGIDTTLEI
jgi:hypothetical protein